MITKHATTASTTSSLGRLNGVLGALSPLSSRPERTPIVSSHDFRLLRLGVSVCVRTFAPWKSS